MRTGNRGEPSINQSVAVNQHILRILVLQTDQTYAKRLDNRDLRDKRFARNIDAYQRQLNESI